MPKASPIPVRAAATMRTHLSSLVSHSRFLFEVARRHPNLPEAVLAKLYDTSGKLRGECCSSKDPSACWDSKRQRIAAELFPFLTKAEQLCEQFHKLPFLEFKKRLRDSLAQSEPSSAPLEQLLEQRASFASSCCLPDAPLLLCASKAAGRRDRFSRDRPPMERRHEAELGNTGNTEGSIGELGWRTSGRWEVSPSPQLVLLQPK
ncbi:hypothetical protein EK904_013524 [Melospiza melodia maxima]|nr:hypothetical protein EK904_013524 [Melospiza melodia maxima]